MYRRYTELHGNDLAGDDICWFAPSIQMNPRLSPAVIERAVAEGGAKARAEFENRWREDTADFLPADVVHSATDFGVHEREPMPGIRYMAFADSAGGTGSDSFALAIAHRDHDGMAILDVIRSRKPRFIPAQVIAEYVVDVLRRYNIHEIQSDAFAGGFHSSEWQRHNIRFMPVSAQPVRISWLRCQSFLLIVAALLITRHYAMSYHLLSGEPITPSGAGGLKGNRQRRL
jgi:hypothetical protein